MENNRELIVSSVNRDGVRFQCYAKWVPYTNSWYFSTNKKKLLGSLYVLEVKGVGSTGVLARRAEAAQELVKLVDFIVAKGVDMRAVELVLRVTREQLGEIATTAWAFNYPLGFYKRCAQTVINMWLGGNYAIYDEAVNTIHRNIGLKHIA